MTGAEVIDRKPNRENAVALTFDDGPAEWTIPILTTLRRVGARATFFLIGEAIRGREEILRRTYEGGHEIGNHAYSHRNFAEEGTPTDEIENELAATSEAIQLVVGIAPVVFRPPGFGYTASVLEAAATCGYEWVVNASVFTDDFNADDPAGIVDRILVNHRGLGSGAIIDLHDGRPEEASDQSRLDRLPTVAAVEEIVPAILASGYKLVTVSELLAMED